MFCFFYALLNIKKYFKVFLIVFFVLKNTFLSHKFYKKLMKNYLKIFLCAFLVCFFSLPTLKAQRKYKSWHHHFDLGIGFFKKDYALSLGWSHLKGLGASQRFKIGYGLRFNAYRGKERDFLPLPYDIRKDEERLDTLRLDKAYSIGIGLGLYLSYDIAARWTIGLNADLLSYQYPLSKPIGVLQSTSLPDSSLITPASLHRYGLFEGRYEDFGTLNAEFYLAYHFHHKWRAKLGVQNLWTEYRTPLPLVENNARFFRTPWLILAGLTFTPFSPNIKCPTQKKQKLKKLKENEF